MALPSHIAAWLSARGPPTSLPQQPPNARGFFLHPASPRSAGAENSNRLDFYPISAPKITAGSGCDYLELHMAIALYAGAVRRG